MYHFGAIFNVYDAFWGFEDRRINERPRPCEHGEISINLITYGRSQDTSNTCIIMSNCQVYIIPALLVYTVEPLTVDTSEIKTLL